MQQLLAPSERLLIINGVVFTSADADLWNSSVIKNARSDTNDTGSGGNSQFLVLDLPGSLTVDNLVNYRQLAHDPRSLTNFDQLIGALATAKYFDLTEILKHFAANTEAGSSVNPRRIAIQQLKQRLASTGWQQAYIHWYTGTLVPQPTNLGYQAYQILTTYQPFPMPAAVALQYCQTDNFELERRSADLISALRSFHPLIGPLIDQGLLSSRAFIAGGAIIEALIATGALKPSQPTAPRPTFDIDIFACFDWEPFVRSVVTLAESYQSQVLISDDNSTISVITPNPPGTPAYPIIQIIGCYSQSWEAVLQDFDLACCQVAFDGHDFQVTEAFNQVSTNDWCEAIPSTVIIPSNRLEKYRARGITFDVMPESIGSIFVQPDLAEVLEQRPMTWPLAYPVEDWTVNYAAAVAPISTQFTTICPLQKAEPWQVFARWQLERSDHHYIAPGDLKTWVVDASFKTDPWQIQLEYSDITSEASVRIEIQKYVSWLEQQLTERLFSQVAGLTVAHNITLAPLVRNNLQEKLDFAEESRFSLDARLVLIPKICYRPENHFQRPFCEISMCCVAMEVKSVKPIE
jgi:hypothetical protein